MSLATEVENLAENLRDTREAIIERGGTVAPTAGFKDLPEAVRSIPNDNGSFDDGYSEGYQTGLTMGIQEGKQAEWSAFWDAHQDYGNRTDYYCGFAGWRTFNPKYDMNVTSAYMMFRGCMFEDIGELLRASGVKIYVDAKKANPLYMFASCPNLKIIDEVYFTTPFAGINSGFAWSNKLEEIRQPILVDENTTYNSGFDSLYELREVRFSGTIGKNGLSFQWSSKLSKASIENIIGCLSTTTSGLSITLSKTAVNNVFTTDEWNALIATKSNWTINLV